MCLRLTNCCYEGSYPWGCCDLLDHAALGNVYYSLIAEVEYHSEVVVAESSSDLELFVFVLQFLNDGGGESGVGACE